MPNQEHMYNTPEPMSSGERNRNIDPREQAREINSSYRSYEERYTGDGARDVWNEGQKVLPIQRRERSVGELVAIIALICIAFLIGTRFVLFPGWLIWAVVAVLVIGGLSVLASNWRVVTIPMPTRAFQIQEHARLVLNSGAGKVNVRRGEEGVITVAATKRASGIGINPESMQVRYDQYGDAVNVTTDVAWNWFQFGLRSVEFEITVPASCDIQVTNGWGGVVVQGTSGVIRLRTGSGGIQARELQGQIALQTGSGGIRAAGLQGQVSAITGSGGIEGDSLRGQAELKTGSGGISVSHSLLSGISRFTTGSGGIEYDGTLDPQGNIEMRTGSGGIRLQLATNIAFSLNAKTGSGGVHNEFGSNETGNGPRTQLRLRTGSGGIYITRGGTMY